MSGHVENNFLTLKVTEYENTIENPDGDSVAPGSASGLLAWIPCTMFVVPDWVTLITKTESNTVFKHA